MMTADAFIRACAAIVREKLPPDADLLVIERQRVARQLFRAAEQWKLAIGAKDFVAVPAQVAELAALEAQAAAEVQRLGERLLQLQASVTVDEPRLAQ